MPIRKPLQPRQHRSARAILAALMLLVSVGLAACTVPKKAATPQPLRVEVWGDSFAAQAVPYIDFYMDLSRKTKVDVHAYGATAMCDWFTDMWNETNPANPFGFHPQVVILQFFGDAFTKCMQQNGVSLSGQALVNKYSADSRYAIGIFTKRGIPVYFMSTPLSIYQSKVYTGLSPLGQMFKQLPTRFPARNLVRYIDGATPLELNGKFTFTLPCLPWETCTGHWANGTKTVVVRQPDGFHFCPVNEKPNIFGIVVCPVAMPGAARFALTMTGALSKTYKL
jgi:hypothetical protein